MKKLTFLIPLIATFSFNAFAQDDVTVEVEEVTMDVMEHPRDHGRHHGRKEINRLVAEYMLENGDITVEELEAMRAERKAVREELQTLRESGDEEALQARLEELREAGDERRDQFKAYVAEHDDLAEAIEERRDEIRERRRDRRQERREQESDS